MPFRVEISGVQGIPSGGTTGQVLTKASNADLDTEWTTVSGGGGYTPTVRMVNGGGTIQNTDEYVIIDPLGGTVTFNMNGPRVDGQVVTLRAVNSGTVNLSWDSFNIIDPAAVGFNSLTWGVYIKVMWVQSLGYWMGLDKGNIGV